MHERAECVWCPTHHAMDELGVITPEARQAGLVKVGLCSVARQAVAEELEGGVGEAADAELADLERYVRSQPDVTMDEAGIDHRVLIPEKRLVAVIAITAALVVLGFVLARVL